MLTFLITGGCGFIGTSLIRRLVATNPEAQIRVLDNLVGGTREDLRRVSNFIEVNSGNISSAAGVVLTVGDVRDGDVLLACARGVDCIIHLAANTGVGPSVDNPRLDMECNVIGTFNVLEAARMNNVKRFIFASSGAPVGEVQPPIHEEIAPHPFSPYGASKLAGEGYCSAYFRTFGLSTVCLRFGNVYGPGSSKKASVVAKFIKLALAGEECVIFGDGRQTRDFIYIDDLVDALLLAIEKPVAGEIFQIASGLERTVGEVASIIGELLLKRGRNMVVSHHIERVGDVLRNFSDTSKAQRMLNWHPKVAIDDGLARTVDWFLAGDLDRF
jgi:UDP-glucose 4-epimerase